MKKKVVISAIGIVTSLGENRKDVWNKVQNGESGIILIKDENVQNNYCQFGGVINYVDTKKINIQGKNVLNRSNKLLVYSVLKALEMYKYEEGVFGDNDPIYIGNQMQYIDESILKLILDNCITEEGMDLSSMGEFLNKMSPLSGIKLLPTTPSHTIAKYLGAHGEGCINYTGSTSGLANLYLAYNQIASGRVERATICASNSPFSSYEYYWLCQEGRLRKTNAEETGGQMLFPFDKKHNGTIAAEGAATIILESEDSALRNDREILCYVEGGSMNTFPGENYLSLTSEGFANTMQCACECAGVEFGDMDIVYTNANSFAEWDNAELEALLKLSGDSKISICNSKGCLGDAGVAAGLFDCALAMESLRQGAYSPVVNYSESDLAEKEDVSRLFEAPEKYQYALINSAGAGGNYCSIVMARNGGANHE
jgi:3-oxoacyl-(acyl-carrier-protein) synthase